MEQRELAGEQGGDAKDDRKFWARWNNEATSYYFSNFPDNWLRVDLFPVFAKFGKVRDVYIAKKRNRLGKRFGFVRFSNVSDSCQLESMLKNVTIGDMRMIVNLPRFQPSKSKVLRHHQSKVVHLASQSHTSLRRDVSYAEICKGPKPTEEGHPNVSSLGDSKSEGKWLGGSSW